MGGRKKAFRREEPRGLCGGGSPAHWTTAEKWHYTYSMFLNQMISLAVTRFEWVNLPATCDERFLEFTLLTNGQATIAFPKSQPGVFYSTQTASFGPTNVYYGPTKWESTGVNGWRFDVDNANGVYVWDNLTRNSIWPSLEVYASELTSIFITKAINRLHARVPFLITGPQEKKTELANVWANITNGDPAVIGLDGFSQNINVEAIKTDVPFLGKELEQELLNTWDAVYRLLGIPNMPVKMERRIEDEVQNYQSATEVFRLDALTARREACHELNERFGQYLDAPIDVVFRSDRSSHNFDATRDLTKGVGDDR